MLDFIFEIIGGLLEEGIFEVLSYIVLHVGRGIVEFVRDVSSMF